MANAIKGEVSLTLSDGRAFTLVLDMEALVEAESIYRKPAPDIWIDVRRGFVGAMRAVLYGALRAHHPEITPREAATMFGRDGEAIADALERSYAAAHAAPVEGKEDRKGENPPGKRSGRSGAKPGLNRKSSGG